MAKPVVHLRLDWEPHTARTAEAAGSEAWLGEVWAAEGIRPERLLRYTEAPEL
jgi:hypothetical protein